VSIAILVVAALAVAAFVVSGARTLGYASYYLAFIPFITLDASVGGLTDLSQLGAGNVLFKLGARATATVLLALALWRVRRRLTRVASSAACLPLYLLVLWALLGLPRTQVPWVPLFRLTELTVFFLTGLVLFAERAHGAAPREVLRWHCLAPAPILGVAVWLASTRPDLAFHTSTDGIARMGHKFMNSNVLGFAAAVTALWSAFELGACATESDPHGGAPVRPRCVAARSPIASSYRELAAPCADAHGHHPADRILWRRLLGR
jgi:hypothetical protein